MKAGAPVVEPPRHRVPCEGVLAVESPERVEIGDVDHLRHLSVEIEMYKTGRRRGPRHVREHRAGGLDQLIFCLVEIRREQEELIVLNAEARPWLADPALAQEECVAAVSELPADHRPLFQRDVIHGEHRS